MKNHMTNCQLAVNKEKILAVKTEDLSKTRRSICSRVMYNLMTNEMINYVK